MGRWVVVGAVGGLAGGGNGGGLQGWRGDPFLLLRSVDAAAVAREVPATAAAATAAAAAGNHSCRAPLMETTLGRQGEQGARQRGRAGRAALSH